MIINEVTQTMANEKKKLEDFISDDIQNSVQFKDDIQRQIASAEQKMSDQLNKAIHELEQKLQLKMTTKQDLKNIEKSIEAIQRGIGREYDAIRQAPPPARQQPQPMEGVEEGKEGEQQQPAPQRQVEEVKGDVEMAADQHASAELIFQGLRKTFEDLLDGVDETAVIIGNIRDVVRDSAITSEFQVNRLQFIQQRLTAIEKSSGENRRQLDGIVSFLSQAGQQQIFKDQFKNEIRALERGIQADLKQAKDLEREIRGVVDNRTAFTDPSFSTENFLRLQDKRNQIVAKKRMLNQKVKTGQPISQAERDEYEDMMVDSITEFIQSSHLAPFNTDFVRNEYKRDIKQEIAASLRQGYIERDVIKAERLDMNPFALEDQIIKPEETKNVRTGLNPQPKLGSQDFYREEAVKQYAKILGSLLQMSDDDVAGQHMINIQNNATFQDVVNSYMTNDTMQRLVDKVILNPDTGIGEGLREEAKRLGSRLLESTSKRIVEAYADQIEHNLQGAYQRMTPFQQWSVALSRDQNELQKRIFQYARIPLKPKELLYDDPNILYPSFSKNVEQNRAQLNELLLQDGGTVNINGPVMPGMGGGGAQNIIQDSDDEEEAKQREERKHLYLENIFKPDQALERVQNQSIYALAEMTGAVTQKEGLFPLIDKRKQLEKEVEQQKKQIKQLQGDKTSSSRFDDLFKYAKDMRTWQEIIANTADTQAYLFSTVSHYRNADEIIDPKLLADIKAISSITGRFRHQIKNEHGVDQGIKQSMNNLADISRDFYIQSIYDTEEKLREHERALFELSQQQADKMAEFENTTVSAQNRMLGFIEGVNNKLGISPTSGTIADQLVKSVQPLMDEIKKYKQDSEIRQNIAASHGTPITANRPYGGGISGGGSLYGKSADRLAMKQKAMDAVPSISRFIRQPNQIQASSVTPAQRKEQFDKGLVGMIDDADLFTDSQKKLVSEIQWDPQRKKLVRKDSSDGKLYDLTQAEKASLASMISDTLIFICQRYFVDMVKFEKNKLRQQSRKAVFVGDEKASTMIEKTNLIFKKIQHGLIKNKDEFIEEIQKTVIGQEGRGRQRGDEVMQEN